MVLQEGVCVDLRDEVRRHIVNDIGGVTAEDVELRLDGVLQGCGVKERQKINSVVSVTDKFDFALDVGPHGAHRAARQSITGFQQGREA